MAGELPYMPPEIGTLMDVGGVVTFTPNAGPGAPLPPNPETDEFQDFSRERDALRKTRQCSLCGGTYTELRMTRVRGRWYCTVNECAEEAQQQ